MHENTQTNIEVKTAIESVLDLFVVEKMSRPSLSYMPLTSLPRKACLYIIDIETRLGLEIHVFLFLKIHEIYSCYFMFFLFLHHSKDHL